jgi:hypothetical protein
VRSLVTPARLKLYRDFGRQTLCQIPRQNHRRLLILPLLMRPTNLNGQPITSGHNVAYRPMLWLGVSLSVWLAILVTASLSSFAAATLDGTTGSLPTEPARNWALECANNEVLVVQHPDSYLRYRFHEVDEKGDRIRDQIETPEGSVARLILRNGHPITAEEDAAEKDRLKAMIDSPSAFARHIRREQDNKKMGINLIKLLPDAMLWSYTPGQPQLPNHGVGDPGLVVLDFKPNPQWSPPKMEAEPLTALQGRVWIDPHSRQMVHLEGNLFRAVNIGWGMVAHIYPGGSAVVQQTNAGGGRWIVEHIVEQLTVRALMVKTVKQRLVYDTSEFQAVPAMSYQQAIRMLLAAPLPSH